MTSDGFGTHHAFAVHATIHRSHRFGRFRTGHRLPQSLKVLLESLLRNQIASDTEGGFTYDFTDPDTPVNTHFDASVKYLREGVPPVILPGKEYGTGPSRGRAAKGTALLAVRAVTAKSCGRCHRSILVGIGVLPVRFAAGQTARCLGLSGEETFQIAGLAGLAGIQTLPRSVRVRATDTSGVAQKFDADVRIDTPAEAGDDRHGSIRPYVLRQLLDDVPITSMHAWAASSAADRNRLIIDHYGFRFTIT